MSLRTLPGRNRWQNMSGSKKITVAAVGTVACATVAGSGVFAAWTSSATTGASVNTTPPLSRPLSRTLAARAGPPE